MRIVISMTTIPARIDRIEPTIESLSCQTRTPDCIYLAVPKKPAREDQKDLVYNIPPFLSKYDVKIVHLKKDHGPICKLLGGIQSENDPDTCIVTVDDDIVYPPCFLEEIEQHSRNYPNEAVGFGGWNFYCRPPFVRMMDSIHDRSNLPAFAVMKNGEPAEGLCGFAGALYKRRFFPHPETMISWIKENRMLFRTDDVVISAYLGYQNIPRRVFKLSTPFGDTVFAMKSTGLSSNDMRAFYHWFAARDYLNQKYKTFGGGSVTLFSAFVLWTVLIVCIVILIGIGFYKLLFL